MQIRNALFILLTVCLAGSASAQTFYSAKEFGISFGASHYFGDLNENYGLDYARPMGGIFGRFHLSPYISVRGSLNYARIGYDDKFNNNEFNKQRNLNFRSDILELSAQAEFNFFRFSTGELGSRFTPYLTGGIGAFYYNPYTIYEDRRYYLRTLGTEGQNAGYDDRKYGRFSVCFPIGVGVKYWWRPGVNIGVEIADRLTLTDYMDDVSQTYIGADKFPSDPQNPNPAYILQDRSIELNPAQPLGRAGKQRGNSQTRDQYLFLQFNISFQLKTYKCPDYVKKGYFMY